MIFFTLCSVCVQVGMAGVASHGDRKDKETDPMTLSYAIRTIGKGRAHMRAVSLRRRGTQEAVRFGQVVDFLTRSFFREPCLRVVAGHRNR